MWCSVGMSKKKSKSKKTAKMPKIITLADWRDEYGVDIRDMDPNMKVADWMESEGLRAGARVYRMLIGG